MGFRLNNHCYVNVQDALSTFNDTAPTTLFNLNTLTILNKFNTSITTSGLITYSVKDQNNTTLTTNATQQLTTCDDTQIISFEQINIVLIFWFVVLLGVIVGYSSSKQKTHVNI